LKCNFRFVVIIIIVVVVVVVEHKCVNGGKFNDPEM
jgi:hypothetical protein